MTQWAYSKTALPFLKNVHEGEPHKLYIMKEDYNTHAKYKWKCRVYHEYSL